MRTGYCVGGVSWVALELRKSGVSDDEQLLELMEDRGYTDALYASQMGGELLRVYVSCPEFVDSADFVGLPRMRQGGSRIVDTPPVERVKRVAEIDRLLDRVLAELPSGKNGEGKPLNFIHLNCYLTGVAKFRSEQASERPRILLTFVEYPPQWLLDCPPAHICALHGSHVSFDQVWHKYILVYQAVSRRAVAEVIRKSKEFAVDDLLAAVELMNEPDYEWLPDEYRIEKSLNPAANPLTKYVTELHLAQIPDRDFSAATELKPWGGFGVQEAEWGIDSRPAVPLLEFSWGAKFDWYISTAASFHEHVSWAVRDEVNIHGLNGSGQKVLIVSSAVTHNNLLYFCQMYKSNKTVFRYVDAIAVHPYHFPGHNIWDSQFRKKERWPDWKSLTPRAYAELCFKRFDFIEEIAQCINMKDQDLSFGLAGKKLWVTEFGIPTKLPGVFNDQHKAWQPFIRKRGDPPLEGVESAVWEDLWDAFLEQVTPQYLQNLGVDAFFFYALRETCVPCFDRHDDDRSNFGLLTQDGHPRTDPATNERLRAFAGPNFVAKSTDSVLRIARLLGLPELRDAPNSIYDTVSMLSASEKRLLYILARDWYSGAGAIVDAGCFLGGSTVALARGLQDRTTTPQSCVIHSFDRFILDPFMIRHYCERDRYQEGDSFQPMYERNISEVRNLVEVHAGDVTEFHWTGGPIELLFIDIAKQWSINDHLLADFFPHLIPGVSLVIQQDYVHEWCPWLHVTMESLSDYFTPLGFVEHNTMVYRCEKQIPAAILKFPVSAYTSEDKIDLMHRSVKRFFGSERAIVECAEAVLLAELGSAEKAYQNIEILKKRFPSDAAAKSAIQAAEGFVLSRRGAE